MTHCWKLLTEVIDKGFLSWRISLMLPKFEWVNKQKDLLTGEMVELLVPGRIQTNLSRSQHGWWTRPGLHGTIPWCKSQDPWPALPPALPMAAIQEFVLPILSWKRWGNVARGISTDTTTLKAWWHEETIRQAQVAEYDEFFRLRGSKCGTYRWANHVGKKELPWKKKDLLKQHIIELIK